MAAASLPPGLIDTDVLIDAERGLPMAVQFLMHQQSAQRIQLSAISAMELLLGCRNRQELVNVEKSLAQMRVHEVTPQACQQAREWIARFSLSYGLQIADALIGATAIEEQLPLFTKNVRHFQMLPGLTVVRPY